MKSALLTCLLASQAFFLFAQYTSVTFDPALKSFNNFEPLPSEQDLMLTGSVAPEVNVVEFIFARGKDDNYKSPLHTAVWERTPENMGNSFKLPINYKLASNNSYNVQVNYYEKVDANHKQQVYEVLTNNLDAYLEQVIVRDNDEIKLEKKPKDVVKHLNEIVYQGLEAYRISNGVAFDGFSDLVLGQLENLDDKKINEIIIHQDTTAQRDLNRLIFHATKNVKTLIHAETRFVLNSDVSRLSRQMEVRGVKTEKRSGYFAVNVGYGAVFIDGDIDNLDYGRSMYLGLSFPLSTSKIAPKFFRNASITTGIFLSNFDDLESRQKVTGPIIKRPVYLGLDYKLFQFIRINAGITALEEETENTGNVSGIENRVFFRPFVGLSAKVNLGIGLDK